MVTAFVLIDVERGRIVDVADRLAGTEGVAEVHSVAGRYDLVAVVRVPTNEAMADLVTSGLLAIDGITRTETLPAFRAHSRHDLETMFDLGEL
jgi:DNA-binding Lrp family transcriptional regulator